MVAPVKHASVKAIPCPYTRNGSREYQEATGFVELAIVMCPRRNKVQYRYRVCERSKHPGSGFSRNLWKQSTSSSHGNDAWKIVVLKHSTQLDGISIRSTHAAMIKRGGWATMWCATMCILFIRAGVLVMDFVNPWCLKFCVNDDTVRKWWWVCNIRCGRRTILRSPQVPPVPRQDLRSRRLPWGRWLANTSSMFPCVMRGCRQFGAYSPDHK